MSGTFTGSTPDVALMLQAGIAAHLEEVVVAGLHAHFDGIFKAKAKEVCESMVTRALLSRDIRRDEWVLQIAINGVRL